eukprot:CAMPEP_0195247362 /NCGR_PEP_ID=MMETSP0706-20130129/922_1 /TAXON_ID=33640 /ORGANISM="Asterionellopsis glacialis, Strain CCMP134" /LENGTH=122 /DNA_ID=CAMNT_0040298853 /DNA_START=96 /DNA_END=461 /DNA_ORIENTATION=-
MPSKRLFIFRKTKPVDKNKVVFKSSDRNITEVSVARVEKNKTFLSTTKGHDGRDDEIIMDQSKLRSLLKERDAQILALTNEVGQLKTKMEKLESQSKSCRCGAYQKSSGGDGPNMKWKHSMW